MRELTEIRRELLGQHASIRGLAEKVRTHEPAPREEPDPSLAHLLFALADGIDAHNDREEYLLGEILPTLDAWGPERLSRMDTHHRSEHRDIADRIRAATELSDPRAALELVLPALDLLLGHMDAEEREFLSRDLLRDDIVNIQQTDG